MIDVFQSIDIFVAYEASKPQEFERKKNMKKKNVALFALSAAALMGLGSCGSEEASSTEPENPGLTLAIDAPEGVDVEVTNTPEGGKYFGGETVNFTVKEDIVDKDVSLVKAAGHVVTEEDGVYSFVMPNVDSTIEVELKTLGDADVLKVSDVDEEMIPTIAEDKYKDPDSIKAFTKAIADVLKGSDALEGDYLREMSFEVQNSPVSDKTLFKDFQNDNSIYQGSGKIYATSDKKLKLELNGRTGTAQSTYKFYGESGFYGDDTFYTRRTCYRGSNSSYYGYQVKADNDDFQLYKVVADDIEEQEGATYDAKTMLKESDAEKKGTIYKVGEILAGTLYEGTNSTSLSFMGVGNKLYNVISEVKTTVAEDKKSYTLEIVSYDISYKDAGTFTRYTNTISVDGDGFLKRAYCVVDKLDAADWVEADGKAAAGAVPVSTSFVKFDVTRGFKHDDVKTTDLADYTMKDYDIELKINRSWANMSYVSTIDGPLSIEAGSVIQGIYFLNYTEENAVILPRFLGTADEGFLGKPTSSGDKEVIKTGTTKLVFDNWLGEKKEFDITFTEPAPYKINASFSSTVANPGKPIILTASVTPAVASQEIEVALDPENPTGATIEKQEDGTYKVTPTKVGQSFVTVTSKTKPELKEVVNFSCEEGVTYDQAITMITTHTFVISEKLNGDIIHFNFESDGNGTIVAVYSGRAYKTSTFTWTGDSETNTFTITQESAVDSTTVKKMIVASANGVITDAEVNSYGKVTEKNGLKTLVKDKVTDLSQGPYYSLD